MKSPSSCAYPATVFALRTRLPGTVSKFRTSPVSSAAVSSLLALMPFPREGMVASSTSLSSTPFRVAHGPSDSIDRCIGWFSAILAHKSRLEV